MESSPAVVVTIPGAKTPIDYYRVINFFCDYNDSTGLLSHTHTRPLPYICHSIDHMRNPYTDPSICAVTKLLPGSSTSPPSLDISCSINSEDLDELDEHLIIALLEGTLRSLVSYPQILQRCDILLGGKHNKEYGLNFKSSDQNLNDIFARVASAFIPIIIPRHPASVP